MVSTKCIQILLYGLEVLPIGQSQLRSVDFMINRLFMKLFKNNDVHLVHVCQDLLHFHLPIQGAFTAKNKQIMDKILSKLVYLSTNVSFVVSK